VPALRPPAKWLKEIPVIIDSATARLELVQKFFPNVEYVEPPQPALPHQHIHQIIGSFGKTATAKKLDDLIIDYRLRTLGSQGRNLLITHKASEAGFKAIAGLATRHHGDVAGDDDYGDVENLGVIGGPFAPKREIASRASAEQGHRVLEEAPVRQTCVALMTDGYGVEFERYGYADPAKMTVHAGIYDSEIEQGIGRGRAVNREAHTPLNVFVYANSPLKMPVTTIERWKRPSRLAKMFLAGYVPTNDADMVRLYPDLFPSKKNPVDAARKARDGWGKAEGEQARVRELAQRAGEAWVTVLCHPKGKGQKSRILFVRHDRLAEAEAGVVRDFGGYVIWRIKPLTTSPAALEREDQEICRSYDLLLQISESSSDDKTRRRVRLPLASYRPATRAPPHQDALF